METGSPVNCNKHISTWLCIASKATLQPPAPVYPFPHLNFAKQQRYRRCNGPQPARGIKLTATIFTGTFGSNWGHSGTILSLEYWHLAKRVQWLVVFYFVAFLNCLSDVRLPFEMLILLFSDSIYEVHIYEVHTYICTTTMTSRVVQGYKEINQHSKNSYTYTILHTIIKLCISQSYYSVHHIFYNNNHLFKYHRFIRNSQFYTITIKCQKISMHRSKTLAALILKKYFHFLHHEYTHH